MENTLNLTIDGMHCGACVRRVTTALQSLDGVTVNSVDVGSAKVTFNAGKTSREEISAAVDRIGFTSRVQ